MKKRNYCLLFLLWLGCLSMTAANRWVVNESGGITWQIDGQIPHKDHIEMSGARVSTVLRWGVDADGAFALNRGMVWPMLRTIPNNTHASLMRKFAWDVTDMIEVNGNSLPKEKVKTISLNGMMVVESEYAFHQKGKLGFTRILFPSVSNPAFCEKYILKNIGEGDMMVEIPSSRSVMITDAKNGVDGSYRLISTLSGQTARLLKPGEELTFSVTIAGYKQSESEISFDIDKELQARKDLIAQFRSNLILDTPDPVINTLFAFSKIRTSESIYDTKGGPMHGPGGEFYYAAIWANDQAEYTNPFFPYLGYEKGNRSAMCSFEHFARFMNPEYKAIPTSIIAEGIDIWAGAGDRGDAAMIAYGASRYALARGDRAEAEKLWPLIEWCLEYCHRNLNESGVVKSDTDELEGRFPAGKANLCTSTLYYDALISAGYLGKELGKSIGAYAGQAAALRKNIDKYFGGTVEGFDTYRHYEGNDVLRSWICMPLTMGIYDRKEATANALFSPRLWTKNGLLTQAGSKTFWDRSTLYALRGVFACGETEKALEHLELYSTERLLGDHVPYAIEAWPEGSQRQLAAESALYCRIITEGIFGMRPTGMRSFVFTPRLPQEWDHMNLRRICAYGNIFDIEVKRLSGKLQVTVISDGKTICNRKIKDGENIRVKF